MLTNIFESRNKTFLNLIKLGDYLGRSLRENVEIFTVDDNQVTYLTESGKAIQGKADKNALNLTNIKVEDATIFENKKVYIHFIYLYLHHFWSFALHFPRLCGPNDSGKRSENFKVFSYPFAELPRWTSKFS